MKIKKILILGSGALKIGEAGEFDYSGSQAIKALKEEGIKTVLVNPNIATIQTSEFLADTVYFLPVQEYFVEKIIEKEKPDGILLSFGGQTALNCGLKLHENGILKKNRVAVLGSPIRAIEISEDRKAFTKHLNSINVPTPLSKTATTVDQALSYAEKIGYPVMVRSGFALGGQGSGIAQNKTQLKNIAEHALSFVPQILIEQYLHHFKEVEYEVVRDKDDNCITVCNMENMDPLGIHTGESIVITPSQTLTNYEYHTLRQVAIKIVRSLGIVGECNVQFALNPNPTQKRDIERGVPRVPMKDERVASAGDPRRVPAGAASEKLVPLWESSPTEDIGRGRSETGPAPESQLDSLDYYVIELNARLSRSSALASKATGYPLAYVAAKLALGKNLVSLQNKVTKATSACFEPALDYVTIKIPRWDINKFKNAEETIGSSMKSVGEVMGIGRTFEEAYQKAIRMLDQEFEGPVNEKYIKGTASEIQKALAAPTPNRMFVLSQAFAIGLAIQEVYELTGIDPWFLFRIQNIVNTEKTLKNKQLDELTKEEMLNLKQLGFSDKRIGTLVGETGLSVREKRKQMDVLPSVFQIDTLAGEFPAQTNYLYLTYNGSHHDVIPLQKKSVIVLGSGPYRIGSSVEFDWTSVHAVMALKKHDKQSVIINCNPETVSTDYDMSDRLYFEELTFERIADIYEFEHPYGVIVSVGGQTPNNRAKALKAHGFSILGTDPADIDRAEDRTKFSALLDSLGISQPSWDKFSTVSGTVNFAQKVGFPVLIRPSYVLSGTYMKICHREEELTAYLQEASSISKDYPVTVSKFITQAKEIESDAVAQNGEVITSVVTEHIEPAGVHSGDASIILPPKQLTEETITRVETITKNIAKALRITGPFNIQCLAKDDSVSVIEVNLRSSRTFPFISKVTGCNFIEEAVDAFFHMNNKKYIIPYRKYPFFAAKVAQFSFARLTGADPVLDVEMTSTGEVACFGETVEEAFLKGELAVGGKIPVKGVFVSLGGEDTKGEFLESARLLSASGLTIFATEKTARFLKDAGIKTNQIFKVHEKKSPNVLTLFYERAVDLVINIVDMSAKKDTRDDYTIRRAAIDHNIPLFTNAQKASLFVRGFTSLKPEDLLIKSWGEYVKNP